MRKLFSNVGQRIEQLLNENRLSKTQLAILTDISKNAVTNYCNGTRLPDTSSIYSIATALNTTVEWLLTGEGIKCTSGTADIEKTFLAPTGRDLYEYLNGVCQIDYATAGERLKQARELAGITVEEAATRAYLKTDALRHLEDESYFTTEHTDLQQIACLAYIYDVDLYWVFSGKARSPAAVLKDGVKNYPPYEFMLKQFPVPTAAGSTAPAASGIKFSKDELNFLDSYSYLSTSGKEAVKTLLAFQLERENLSSSSSLNHDIKKDKLA